MPTTEPMLENKLLKLSIDPSYTTDWGRAFCGGSIDLLAQVPDDSVSLIMTSPPFALQGKKEYGNKDQSEYIDWLSEFAKIVLEKLKPDDSFVLDLGGAYRKGAPQEAFITSESQFIFVIRSGLFGGRFLLVQSV